jgi:hypothetical protein
MTGRVTDPPPVPAPTAGRYSSADTSLNVRSIEGRRFRGRQTEDQLHVRRNPLCTLVGRYRSVRWPWSCVTSHLPTPTAASLSSPSPFPRPCSAVSPCSCTDRRRGPSCSAADRALRGVTMTRSCGRPIVPMSVRGRRVPLRIMPQRHQPSWGTVSDEYIRLIPTNRDWQPTPVGRRRGRITPRLDPRRGRGSRVPGSGYSYIPLLTSPLVRPAATASNVQSHLPTESSPDR